MLIAGAVLMPWRLRAREHAAGLATRRAPSPSLGGVFFALDIALWNTSVMHTGAAVASILGNNTPVFVGILTWLVLRQAAAGVVLDRPVALAGRLPARSCSDPRAPGRRRSRLYGNLLAIGGSAFFAAYLITTERVRRSMDTLTFNTLAIAGSIATLLRAVPGAAACRLRGYPPRTWLALAGLGLVSQLAAYYALVYALGHLPATITSVGLLAQVPVHRAPRVAPARRAADRRSRSPAARSSSRGYMW